MKAKYLFGFFVFYLWSMITAVSLYAAEVLEYEAQEDGTLAVCKCTADAREVVIPSEVDGKKVTLIGSFAFSECRNLKSVKIPDSVTEIGDCAFQNCDSLTDISLPESVTAIDQGAFMLCGSLKEVIIPSGIKVIEKDVFNGCSGLVNVSIPDKTTGIYENAFYDCISLKDITLPDNIEVIGFCSFYNCTALTEVTIPYGTKIIDMYAFFGCSNLKGVGIPDSVVRIGGYAFQDTKWLEDRQKENPLVVVNNILISGLACRGKVTIPEEVKVIGEYAFCKSEEETNDTALDIIFSDSVKKIERSAFANCTGLKSVRLSEKLTVIDVWAFSGCSGLTRLIIPDSVTAVGEAAFKNCVGLVNVIFSQNMTDIADATFASCTNLTSVVIPQSVVRIGEGAFSESSLHIIYGERGSYAKRWAETAGYEFKDVIYCSFDADGGTVDLDRKIVLQYDKYNDLPVPVKENCEFLGWYTQKAEGERVTEDTLVSLAFSHTLYAHWKAKTNANNSSSSETGSLQKNPSGSEIVNGKKVQIIKASSKTATYNSKPFYLKAKASGGGKLTYKSSNNKIITVSSKGKITVKRYGQAVIIIRASAKGKYMAATKRVTIKVVPKTPKLIKVYSKEKKTLESRWQKDKTVSGYQLYACKEKNFKKGIYKREYRNTRKYMKLYGLKSKKTYYVKLRSYKKVGNKKYYSGWSKIKSTKIK